MEYIYFYNTEIFNLQQKRHQKVCEYLNFVKIPLILRYLKTWAAGGYLPLKEGFYIVYNVPCNNVKTVLIKEASFPNFHHKKLSPWKLTLKPAEFLKRNNPSYIVGAFNYHL